MKKNIFKIFLTGGITIAFISLIKKIWNEYKRILEDCAKFRLYFHIFDKWMKIKEAEGTLETYFIENNFSSIAIYGLGALGRHLLDDLKNSRKIQIAYVIDKDADVIKSQFHILNYNEKLPDVDAVIVTAILDFGEIRDMLSEKLKCPIISLEEVIDDYN